MEKKSNKHLLKVICKYSCTYMWYLFMSILNRGQQQQQQQQQPTQQQGVVPCARELEEFIKCTQTSNDLKFCEGLNYMFKQCKMDQGTYNQ